MATPLPPSLKPLVPFTKQASQLEKYDAVMSYYCMFYFSNNINRYLLQNNITLFINAHLSLITVNVHLIFL